MGTNFIARVKSIGGLISSLIASFRENDDYRLAVTSNVRFKTRPHGENGIFSYGLILSKKVCELKKKLKEPRIGQARLSDFNIVGLVGEGSFGAVLEVTHRATNKRYALKRQRKQIIMAADGLERLKQERIIHAALDLDFIVKLFGCMKDNLNVYFILEFIPCGDFLHFLKQYILREDHVSFYIGQVVLALEYLHAGGIVYRDLKPDNLLVHSNGYVKLADFGISKLIHAGHTFTVIGSLAYMAPEIFVESRGYDKGVDWWALGALCYVMLFRTPTHVAPTATECIAMKQKPIELQVTSNVSEATRHFLIQLLEPRPELRLGVSRGGISKVKSHPFFSRFDWLKLYCRKYLPPVPRPTRGASKPFSADEFSTSDQVAFEQEFMFF